VVTDGVETCRPKNTAMNATLEPATRNPNVLREPEPSLGAKHILLVEDDPAINRLMAKVLTHAGYQVDTAEDGQAGWEALCKHQHDLLITDNVMPGLSGLELAEKIRSAHMEMPILLISGSLVQSELKNNPSLHIASLLNKPFRIDELLNEVKKALSKSEREPVPAESHSAIQSGWFSRINPYWHGGINE
jgi:DNA-binding response OmpR family regulator